MEKCPYCNKNNFIPVRILNNVEAYGGKTYRFPCCHCGEIVKATFRREIIINNVEKTEKLSNF